MALDKLSKSDDIKVMKADKGGAVVVMNATEDDIKGMRLLNDTDIYLKLIKPPPISNIQTKFNKDVKNIISSLLYPVI